MKQICLLIVLLISCMVGPHNLWAQSSYYQVSVYFASGVQRVVQPGDTAATVTSQDVLNVLSKYSLTSSNVYPAYPSFIEADTIVTIDSAGDKIRQMDRAKVFVITVTDTGTQSKLTNDLNGLTEVLFAEANGNNKDYIVPNDPGFVNQWGLNNTTTPGDDIHAEKAWDIFTGNPNSIIGIIDDGVDGTHPDLTSKIAGGDKTFSIMGSGPGAFSHGTLIAGIAAASTNNGVGIAGVDWQAKLLPEDKSDYWLCFCINYLFQPHGDALISQKIYQAVDFSRNVWTLNNSYGLVTTGGAPGRYSTLVRAAFAYAYKSNRLSCAAVGSDAPNSNEFPAGFNTGLLAVASTDNQDNPYASTTGNFVDVGAPGYNIYTTNYNDQYTTQQGTSLATAFVSGLASLLKGYNTNLLNDDIIRIIELSADYKGTSSPPWDAARGYGRINAQTALEYLEAPYQLQHLTTTGGTTYATSGTTKMVMLGAMGLSDALYIAKRVEVRTTINLPTNYCSNIQVWGTGIGSTGLHDDGQICYGEPFCQVVPGSQTSTQATLRTYVYQLYDEIGDYLGYYPVAPSQVKFAYSVFGVVQPAISGESTVCTVSTPYTLTNLPAIASVAWNATPTGVAQINSPNSNSTTITKLSSGTITLNAVLTNGCGVNQNFTASKTVAVGAPAVGITYSPYGSCQGSTQTWSLSANPVSNGSNWAWSVGVLGQNSSIYIHSPSSPNTLADVTGGGTVNLNYTDLCGSAEKTGVTLYSSCHAMAILSPNPSSGMLTVSTTPVSQAPTESSAATAAPWKIYRIQVVAQNGKVVKLFNYPSGIASSTINLSDLNNGIYSLQIYDNTTWTVQQVVILK